MSENAQPFHEAGSSGTESKNQESYLTVGWLKEAKIDPSTGHTAVNSLLEWPDETQAWLQFHNENGKSSKVSELFLSRGEEVNDILDQSQWSEFMTHARSYLQGHWKTDLTRHFCSELEKEVCESLGYDGARTEEIRGLLATSHQPIKAGAVPHTRISLSSKGTDMIYTDPMPSKNTYISSLMNHPTSADAQEWPMLEIRSACTDRFDKACEKIKAEKTTFEEWKKESSTAGKPESSSG